MGWERAFTEGSGRRWDDAGESGPTAFAAAPCRAPCRRRASQTDFLNDISGQLLGLGLALHGTDNAGERLAHVCPRLVERRSLREAPGKAGDFGPVSRALFVPMKDDAKCHYARYCVGAGLHLLASSI